MSDKNGIKIIDEIFSNFQNIINALEDGINLCEKQVDYNNKKIVELKEENDLLTGNIKRANTFKDVLTGGLEPIVEKK